MWSRAVEYRREWLEIAVSCKPADHAVTEEAIASIYARHRRPRPEFLWVPSPRAAVPHLKGLPTHDDLRAWLGVRRPPGRGPVASDIAAGLSRLRFSLESGFDEPPADRPVPKRPWPVLPPDQALEAGLPLREVLTRGVRDAVLKSLGGLYLPIRAAAGPLPVGWYGHQDTGIVFGDVLRRAVTPHLGGDREHELWATLNRSSGWWWPGDERCVLVERPVVLQTAPVPGAWHDEIRLIHVEYADGWSVRPAG